MSKNTQLGIAVGLVVFLAISLYLYHAYHKGYVKGSLEYVKAHLRNEIKHPTLGQLRWSVDDECLYIWRGEENEPWLKTCQPCEEDTP